MASKKKKRIRIELLSERAEYLQNEFHIGLEDGWIGVLTRDEAPQAKFKNGARIRKTINERGDLTPVGTGGRILGSIFSNVAGGVGYFIEWDDKPREAIFCIEGRIGG